MTSLGSNAHAGSRSKALPWLIAMAVVVTISSMVALSSGAWVNASGTGGTGTGGTGGTIPSVEIPDLEMLDGLGLPLQLISLPLIGSSQTVSVSVNGFPTVGADTFQVLVQHDPSVTSISNASCSGPFESAFSPIDAVVIDSESASGFLCFNSVGVDAGTGTVIEFDIERVGFGSDLVSLSGSGPYATAFFAEGEVLPVTLPSPFQVLNLEAPSPTPQPTSTSAPASGGGGSAPPTASNPAPNVTRPGVPENITTEAGDRLAIIRWDPPVSSGGALITTYTASILGGTAAQILPSTARAAVFTNLQNGEPVQLRVWASNAAGNGPPSEAISVQPFGPPGPPQFPTAELLSDGQSIAVSWQAPQSDNGAEIESYQVNVEGAGIEPVHVDAQTLSVTITNLPSGSYSVTVTAVNAAGAGEVSTPVGPLLVGNAPTVGAPGEPPGGATESPKSPSRSLPTKDLEIIAEAVGGSHSESEESAEIQIGSDGKMISLPIALTGGVDPAAANFEISTPDLDMTFSGGAGNFKITLSSDAVLRGIGKLQNLNQQLVVEVDELRLIYSPDLTHAGTESGRSIEFEVNLTGIPGDLITTKVDSFENLVVSGALQLVSSLDSNGVQFGDGFRDIALLVQVATADVDSGMFGTNSVSITVETGWLDNEAGQDRLIRVLKIDDRGFSYLVEPVCSEISPGFSLCNSVFSGAAAGFSSFALLSLERELAPTPEPFTRATPSPTTTSLPGATATPVPSTPIVSEAPEDPSDSGVTQTPSPLPQPLPTPGIGGDSNSNGANIYVVVIVVVVVIGSVSGTFFILWRRRRPGLTIGILLLLILGTPALLQNDASAHTSRPANSPVGLQATTLNKGVQLNISPRGASQQAAVTQSQSLENPLHVLGTQVTGDHVLIHAATDAPNALAVELDALGITGKTVGEDSVSGRIPLTSYGRLENLQANAHVTIEQPFTRSGSVVSEGDAAHRTDFARSFYGVDGSGVTVGVISDSWDCLNQYQTDVAAGELPANVIVLEEISSCSGAIDEGRAMAQIIHDLAPGADIMFHTGFNGSVNMADGIRELAAAGADIIVDDIGYRNQPYFQDGTIGEAVNDVVDDGVSYFSSAGNSGDNSYESEFIPGDPLPPGRFPSALGAPPFLGGVPHDFTSTNQGWLQRFSMNPGDFLRIDFQWDDTFLGINGIGAASEMDLYIFDESGTVVVAGALSQSIGFDPFESITLLYTPPPGTQPFNGKIALIHDGGPTPPRIKFIFNTSHPNEAGFNQFTPGFGAGTIYGHPNSRGAIAVGAVEHKRTPEVDGYWDRQSPTERIVEKFSSRGGVPILRDKSGAPVPPVTRSRPDFVAADGTGTTVSGFSSFYGTSAAAPHAAAIAALMLETAPESSPELVRESLSLTALNMYQQGFDNTSGFGAIHAPGAISQVALIHSGQEYDYDATGLDVSASDLVFLAVKATNGLPGNRVLAIDPTTGLEIWSFELPFAPDQVAVASDGSKIYVTDQSTNRVIRIDIATSLIDLDFSNPVPRNTFGPPTEQNLAVQPGNADILAVTSASTDEPLFLLENGVIMPAANRFSDEGREFVFSEDGSVLFATRFPGRPMKLEITESGLLLTGTAVIPGSSETSFLDRIVFGNNLLFTSSGIVVDANNLNFVDDFVLKSGTIWNVALVALSGDAERGLYIGRIPITGEQFTIGSLQAYDLPTGGYIGSMPFPFTDEDVEDLELWGTHGFALRRESGGVFIGSTELIEDAFSVTGNVSLKGIDPTLAANVISVNAIPGIGEPIPGAVNSIGTADFLVLNGIYEIVASAPGFLSASASGFNAIDSGGVLENAELIPGDSNSDDVIDATDALLVASAYGSALQVTFAIDELGVATDFDGDGLTTGRDASLQMKSFGMTGPIPWLVDETDPIPEPDPTPSPGPGVSCNSSTRTEFISDTDGIPVPQVGVPGGDFIPYVCESEFLANNSPDSGSSFDGPFGSVGTSFVANGNLRITNPEIDVEPNLLHGLRRSDARGQATTAPALEAVSGGATTPLLMEFSTGTTAVSFMVMSLAADGAYVVVEDTSGNSETFMIETGSQARFFGVSSTDGIKRVFLGTASKTGSGGIAVDNVAYTGGTITWPVPQPPDSNCSDSEITDVVLGTEQLKHPSFDATTQGEISVFLCLSDFLSSTTTDSVVDFDGPLANLGTVHEVNGNIRFTSPRLNRQPAILVDLVTTEGGGIATTAPILRSVELSNSDFPLVAEFSEGTGAAGLHIVGPVSQPVFVIAEDSAGAAMLIFINAKIGEGAFIGFDSPTGITRIYTGRAMNGSWMAIDNVHYSAGSAFAAATPTPTMAPTATPTQGPSPTPIVFPEGQVTMQFESNCFNLETGTIASDFSISSFGCPSETHFRFAFNGDRTPHAVLFQNQIEGALIAYSPEDFDQVTLEDVGALVFTTNLIDIPFEQVAVLKTADGTYYKIGPITEDVATNTVTFEWARL